MLVDLKNRSQLMNKALGTAVACLAIGASLLPATASAQRYRFHDQDRFIQRYCDGNWDRDCDDWRYNRHRWDEARYHRWYRHHHDDFGPEDAAASIFGFVAGAAAGAITGAVGTTHAAACEARYRSYDWQTDTYMGFDGERHYCRL
jgi:hypothetical protein